MRFRQSLSRLLLTCACGACVSAQMLGDNFEPPLFGHFTPLFDHLVKAALANGENDQALLSDAEKSVLALAGKSRLTCEAAKRRALEIAPELLSLADWPLDDHEPAECLNKQHASVAVLYETLKEIVEIAAPAPVVTVTATISGEDAPAAKKSSPRPTLAEIQPHPFDQQLVALDMDSLDEIRGGFELQGSGLRFSIGIERAVFINGNLVANTILVPKNPQQATGGGSASAIPPAAGSGGSLSVIQNGTGNNVSAQISPNLAGTVIQNTLNDQKIQSVTTINASINSLQAMRAMSIQNAVQTGIISSLRR